MKRVQTGLRLTEDVVRELRKRAEENGSTFNGYLERVIEDHLREKGYYKEEEIPDRIRISVSKETKARLKERCRETGMSVKEQLEEFLCKKNDVHVEIMVTDLLQLLRKMDLIVTLINGVYTVMAKSGKVYEGEMQTILRYVREMNEKVNLIFETEYRDRSEILVDVRKRIYKETRVPMIRRKDKSRCRSQE